MFIWDLGRESCKFWNQFCYTFKICAQFVHFLILDEFLLFSSMNRIVIAIAESVKIVILSDFFVTNFVMMLFRLFMRTEWLLLLFSEPGHNS